MSYRNDRAAQQLHAFVFGRDILSTAIREQRFTKPRTTVSLAIRAWIALTIAACGAHHRDAAAYAQATSDEQTCCEHLSGSGRDSCLSAIVRVSDPTVQNTAANQRTYACMAENFSCDATTGHATQQSAQAQLDCIEDLHQ
jgi:hypothetical protein